MTICKKNILKSWEAQPYGVWPIHGGLKWIPADSEVLQYAILPEASSGADKYLSFLTSITDVEISGDLQVFWEIVQIEELGRVTFCCSCDVL